MKKCVFLFFLLLVSFLKTKGQISYESGLSYGVSHRFVSYKGVVHSSDLVYRFTQHTGISFGYHSYFDSKRESFIWPHDEYYHHYAFQSALLSVMFFPINFNGHALRLTAGGLLAKIKQHVPYSWSESEFENRINRELIPSVFSTTGYFLNIRYDYEFTELLSIGMGGQSYMFSNVNASEVFSIGAFLTINLFK